MSSPEFKAQPQNRDLEETDPTIRMMRSEFALGINGDHVFGDEPIAPRQARNTGDENRSTMIVRFTDDGVHVEFEAPDGTRHQ